MKVAELPVPSRTRPSAEQRVYTTSKQAEISAGRVTLDIEIVWLLSAVAALLVWLPAPLLVRLPAGLLAVLLLPGYSVAVACFPDNHGFDLVEWLAICIGASLAIIPLLALVLNEMPWGVRPEPTVIGLSVVTTMASTAAWRRRRAAAAAGLAAPRSGVARTAWRSSRLPLVFAGAGLLLAGAALLIPLATAPGPRTKFFALGQSGQAASYPSHAIAGQPVVVQVGVTSHETDGAVYTIQALSASGNVGSAGPIALKPGATWQGPLRIALSQPGDDQPVQINLMKDGSIYRQLRLWLDVSASQP